MGAKWPHTRGGVHDHVKALVGAEAEEKWDRCVSEDVHVGELEGEWLVLGVGRGDAQGEASERDGDVAAQRESRRGGTEGGRGG